MINYCRADVELLSKTILKFRKLFKHNLDTDPFRYTTLASLCMSIYLNKFLPEKTIVGNSTEKQNSPVYREWLTHLNDDPRGAAFQIERKVPLKDGEGKHIVTADGCCFETKTAYQFQGCFWHGCKKCCPQNVKKQEKNRSDKHQASGERVQTGGDVGMRLG